MKTTAMIITGTALSLAVSTAMADKASGTAKANFKTDELSIPCVMIEEHSEAVDGMFYDIVLKRRGKSMNYELMYAEPEDTVLCERIADLAEYEEEDETPTPEILVQCDIVGDRTTIQVNGKNLEEADYLATVYSGENSLEAMAINANSGEVEYTFDTDADAVADGAEPLEADFVVDEEVSADIWMVDATEAVLVSEAVSCMVEEPEEDDSSTENA